MTHDHRWSLLMLVVLVAACTIVDQPWLAAIQGAFAGFSIGARMHRMFPRYI